MISIRVGTREDSHLQSLATSLARAVEAHPLASVLPGIVLIGLGEPYLIGPGDPRPRIALPLASSQHVDPIARAQALAANGLVFLDTEEMTRVLRGDRWSGLAATLTKRGDHEPWQILRGVNVLENASAVAALRSKEDARKTLAAFRPEIPSPPVDLQRLADLTVELVVAALDPTNPPAAE